MSVGKPADTGVTNWLRFSARGVITSRECLAILFLRSKQPRKTVAHRNIANSGRPTPRPMASDFVARLCAVWVSPTVSPVVMARSVPVSWPLLVGGGGLVMLAVLLVYA